MLAPPSGGPDEPQVVALQLRRPPATARRARTSSSTSAAITVVRGIAFYVCVADLEDELIRTHSGRKTRYARLLVDALELTSVPRPLDRLLAHL